VKARRKTRREQQQKLRQQAAAAGAGLPTTSEKCAQSADPNAPIAGLTRKRMAFAMAWAEADPEDSLGDIARRAGYSESSATSGIVADICRDPNVIKMRDRRLAELQRASGVTVEDQLLGLRALAEDPATPAKDRVAARKAILAWYAHDKGQHKPEAPAEKKTSRSVEDWADEFTVDVLGVRLNEPEAS